MNAWSHYIAAWAVVATASAAAPGDEPNRLLLESGPGSVAGVTWSAFELRLEPAATGGVGWRLHVSGLEGPVALGEATLTCMRGGLAGGSPSCREGEFQWLLPEAEPLQGSFELAASANGDGWRVRLGLAAEQGEIDLESTATGLSVVARNLDLSGLPAGAVAVGGLAHLEGRVDRLEAHFEDTGIRLRAQLSGLGWDNRDGTLAGAGVDLAIRAGLEPQASGQRFDIRLEQAAGEVLLGPVYLPPPDAPVVVEAAGYLEEDGSLRVTGFSLDDPEALSLRGDMQARLEDGVPVPTRVGIDHLEAHLPAARVRYLDGVLGRYGLDGLDASGRLQAQANWRDGRLTSLEATFDAVTVDDPRGRFGIAGLDGRLTWHGDADRLETDLLWTAAGLYALPLGGGELHLETREDDLVLRQPLTVPLFDGALVLEDFRWLGWRGDSPRLDLDARIDPLDLARLSRALGWPELGGTVSGGIRDVTYADGVLAFGGGIDISAFSGAIQVDSLSIERPFGTLPVLAADITMDDLDLLEVTGAFGFGRMDGRMDARVRRLRMLNWQPVAFDAELYTVPGPGRQRISQRAVDNLSSLGGAGGAVLSSTLLRFFEDFGYARAGLSCRLSNNICRMGGVAEADEGNGYIIVAGRGLPHLDVVGFRRLVDWPRLLTQLRAAAAGQ